MVVPMIRRQHHAATIREALVGAPDTLSSGDRLVLVVVMLHVEADGMARVSRDRLAEMCGLAPLTVKRAMNRLRAEGLLGAPVLTSDGSGYRTYRHPVLVS